MRLDEFLENRDQYRQDDDRVDVLVAQLVEHVGRVIGVPGDYEYDELSRLYADYIYESDAVSEEFDCCWLSDVAANVVGTLVELHKEVTKK